jgi:CubicO group peptidase (beta-lactamase class C family)
MNQAVQRLQSVRFGTMVAVAVLAGFLSAAQVPPAEVQAPASAFFEALASFDPARFEAMAQATFTPDLLARRTADERRQVVARLKNDFGTLTLAGMEYSGGDTITLVVRGTGAMEGRIELVFEPAAPRRISLMGIRVEAGARSPDSQLPPPPIRATMAAAELRGALDAYVRALAAAGTFSGVVLVAKDGAPIYQRAYGVADRETQAPNTIETRFNLGSINKVFTKTAVGQLISQGTLALSDTIGKLLPDYPNAQARRATVEQLLTHRAGVADFFGPAFDDTPKPQFRSNADYYRFVAPQPLLFEPGASSRYCNGCYVVLGAIIERAAHQRYEDYVAEHVYRPAGMSGAGAFQSDRLPANVALGYTRQARGTGGALVSAAGLHGASGSAAGGGYATAADLLAWENAMRDGRLLNRRMTAWFFGNDAPSEGRNRSGIGFAGGAPGINASMESDGTWSVITLGNLDPPAATRLAQAIFRQLSAK